MTTNSEGENLKKYINFCDGELARYKVLSENMSNQDPDSLVVRSFNSAVAVLKKNKKESEQKLLFLTLEHVIRTETPLPPFFLKTILDYL